ncbi:JmjC domain-containing protein [Kutzneria sp. NPDC052558]|uniref:JmjC domain-containing protein n=1 Tax=Kutzneria sp. NPDC052558 TaxID=3364121 RepID=UPI0037C5F42E
MTTLGFEHWFRSLGIEDFGAGEVGREPLFVPASQERADAAMRAIGVNSVEDVFQLSDSTMYAWFQRLDGKHTAAKIPAESAAKIYAGGTTVYLTEIAKFHQLELEATAYFGLPSNAAKVELFCNRPSAVTTTHFDTVDVTTIQLRGRKTWRIAPNEFAPGPKQPWGVGEKVPASLRMYAEGVTPKEMPDGALEFTLDPGAVLHVPRGYWHSTFSDRDSMSLHLQCVSPSRLDAVLAVVRNELARDLYWRENAYRPELDEQALQVLRTAIGRLDPRDLGRTPVDDGPVDLNEPLERAGQAALGIAADDGKTARIEVTTYRGHGNRTTTLNLSSEFVPACRWVNALATGAAFDAGDLLRAAPGLSKQSAQELARTLVRTQLARR